jgi:hypothetical protein
VSREDVRLSYYPHKDACPQNSKSCIKEKCKFWIGEKRCWEREFDDLIAETFHSDYYDYIHFKDETGHHLEAIRHLYFYMALSDKENKEIPISVTVAIGFTSHRLAENVQIKFNLTDWEIQSRCEDGGDDHDLEKIIIGNYENKKDILDLLSFLQDLIPKIVEFEKGINTCAVCGSHCDSLTEYSGKAICGWCERKIITENMDKYIKT